MGTPDETPSRGAGRHRALHARRSGSELLPKLDLSQPVWLPRHRADWDEYALTRFLPEHFMEAVPFDYMEISYIFPEDEKKAARPRDPRWDA